MNKQYGIFDTLFAKIGWVKSNDSNGFDVYTIPDGMILNEIPSSYDPSAMDDSVFIDGISFEEDSVGSIGTFTYKVEGDVHFGKLDCIRPFLDNMIKNRSTCIIFPRKTTKKMIIDSILEVFPGKYTREQLESKQFVSSNGNRKNR